MAFSVEQGKLLLRYTGGELCLDGKTRMSTQITFDCDTNSDAVSVGDGNVYSNEEGNSNNSFHSQSEDEAITTVIII